MDSRERIVVGNFISVIGKRKISHGKYLFKEIRIEH